MNVAVYAISWQSAIRAALKTSNLNQLLKDLTMVYLIWTLSVQSVLYICI